MKVTPKKYAQLLLELTADKKNAEEIKIILNKFINLLVQKNQLKNYSQIIKEFKQLWNRKNNILEAEVITAHPIAADIKGNIKDFIRKKTSAKKINLENKVDKNLIAGALIKYGDRIIDNTLKNRINNLKININT